MALKSLVRRHSVGALVGTAIALEVALVPVFLLTGADAALEDALDAAGMDFTTDLLSAARLLVAEPAVWWAVGLALLQVASPDIALLVVARVAAAPEWLRDVVRRIRWWHPSIAARRGLRVWATVIALFSAMNIASGALHRLRFDGADDGTTFSWSIAPTWGALVLFCAAMFLDAGAVFEENAWRGFALPRLQEQRGPLVGSIVLGLLWSLWHVPVKFGVFLDYGLAGGTTLFGAMTVKLVALSIVMTHFSNRVGSSTLLAIAMHGLANDTVRLGGLVEPASLASEVATEANLALPLVAVAAALVVRTSGRLAFDDLPASARMPVAASMAR